jgi:hypothetical protein
MSNICQTIHHHQIGIIWIGKWKVGDESMEIEMTAMEELVMALGI